MHDAIGETVDIAQMDEPLRFAIIEVVRLDAIIEFCLSERRYQSRIITVAALLMGHCDDLPLVIDEL